MTNHAYACSDCGYRQPEAGKCSRCGEEPVLELAASGTVEMLREQDRQRADRARSRALWIALPVGMITGVLLAGVFPKVLALIPLPIPFALPIKVVVLMVLVTVGLMQALLRLLPAKQWWQDLEPESKSTRDMTAAMRGMPTGSSTLKVALFVGAGALVVGLGAVATTYGEIEAQQDQQAAQAAYAKLSTCLVGGDVGAVGVGTRLRSIELRSESEPADATWPARCNEHAKALFDTLEGSKQYASVRSTLATKIGCAKSCDLAAAKVHVGALFVVAQQAGLRAEVDPDVTPPAYDEDRSMTAGQFPRLGSKALRLVDYVWLEDGTLAALMHEPGRAMSLCEVDFAAGARDASCRALFGARSPVAPSSARLLAGADEPVVFGVTKASLHGTDDDGADPITGRSRPAFGLGSRAGRIKKPEPKRVEVERGAFRAADGTPVDVHFGEHEAAGRGLFVERRGEDHRVVRVDAGKAKGGFTLRGKDVASGPWVGGEYVAWIERDDGNHVLKHQKVGPTGSKQGAAKAVAELSGYPAKPTRCQMGETHVAVIGNGTGASMSFLTEEGWSAPVRAMDTEEVGRRPAPKGSNRYGIKGPKDSPDPHAARAEALRTAASSGVLSLLGDPPSDLGGVFGSDGGLGSAFGTGGLGLGSSRSKPRGRSVADPPKVTCGDGTATLTEHRVTGREVRITQMRCTPGGCTRKEARLRDVPVKSMWMVSSLGEAVLMLWRAPSGALRARVAPIERLAETQDVIVFDAPDYGGPKTGSRQFFTDGKTAVVFFTDEGLHGLWIAADGSFGAVRS